MTMRPFETRSSGSLRYLHDYAAVTAQGLTEPA